MSGRFNGDAKVGIDLGDATSGDDRLVHAKVEHARGDPVEVGELESVEVGEAYFAGETFHRNDVGDGVARAESHDTDAQRALASLLRARHLVAVSVQSKS